MKTKCTLGLILLLLFTHTGCTPFKVPATSSKVLASDSPASNSKQSVGLARQSQLYTALKICLSLPDEAISAQTKATYDTVKSNLSAEGQLNDLNAPMLMALVQITSEMCNDRITLEAEPSKRDIFSEFNFEGADFAATDATSVSKVVSRLAKSCWGREATLLEVQLIREEFLASKAGMKLDKTAALYLCTTVLSSPTILAY